jgi:hypothetical protein
MWPGMPPGRFPACRPTRQTNAHTILPASGSAARARPTQRHRRRQDPYKRTYPYPRSERESRRMSEPIPRYKPKAIWTAADFLAEKRGERPPETDECRQARRDALADAGLVDEGELERSNTDDLVTSGEYLRRIQKGN